MNSSVQGAPGFLQMTVYAFWALTLILAVLTLLVFRRKTHSESSGLGKWPWIVIVLAIFIQLAALALSGRVVGLVFHVISLLAISAGLLIFGAYAIYLTLAERSRNRNASG
ncbi:MAG TPA: hypothetical protein VL689_13730 [Paraburkholderia sp.]|jgi:hypothetical protein|nr:hypothetical protein [Paraburkholderia sp.]